MASSNEEQKIQKLVEKIKKIWSSKKATWNYNKRKK